MKKPIFLTIVTVFIVLFLASSVIFKVYDVEVLPSQFYGALIGVFITLIVTHLLLEGQTKGDVHRARDIKIYSKKLKVYSEFTTKMWEMANNDNDDNDEKIEKRYQELRLMCFEKLAFFLKHDEIDKLTKTIEKIDKTGLIDRNLPHFCKITSILQNSLEEDKNKDENESIALQNLYNAFNKADLKNEEDETVIQETAEQSKDPVRYWHFNTLGDAQLKAFKNNNWILSLIEYGEKWRTNALSHVKPNDVVFLFKRGGSGYIGAFRAVGTKIFNETSWKEDKDANKSQFDIYNAFEDGASLVSSIIVEPIAFNYKGVGCKSVRRSTIERIHDKEAVNYLLTRFKGYELNENQKQGVGKLDNDTELKIKDTNIEFFNKL
jgi:hypothetical protein